MSRTPSQPAGASRPGATPGPAGAGTPKSTTGPAAPLTRRNLIIGSAVAGGLVLLVALFVWKPWAPPPPRLNDDPALIAKFAASSRFHSLPFDHQRQFMELLDDKDERVEEAYEQGMLNDQEFRRALQLEWYGEHLKKMDKFYGKMPTMRAMYLDQQVDKKRRKKAKRKNEPKPDPKSALTVDEIDRDDSTEEQDIKRWPPDVRQRWTEYRAAYASRKQFWKDQAKLREEAREANRGTTGDPVNADPSTGPEAAATGGPAGP